MKQDHMMENGEQLLWEGKQSEEASFWNAVFGQTLLITLIWLVFFGGILCALIASEGFEPVFLVMVICLILPVLVYIFGIIKSKSKARNVRYFITTRGVYIQTGKKGREITKFFPFGQIERVLIKRGSIEEKYHVGDISCSFFHPLKNQNGEDEYGFKLENIADYLDAAEIIKAQNREYRLRGLAEERKLHQEYLQAIDGYDTAEKLKPQTEPETEQQTEPEPVTEILPEQHILPEFDKSDSLTEEQLAYLENLPDESVSAIQAELFGANSEQQGAFADPTVNPLPELPEPPQDTEHGQFMQRGF